MKLQKYLKENDMTISGFSRDSEISRTTIVRALRGGEIYLSIAAKIEKFTKGSVSIKDLMPTKLRSKVVAPVEKVSKEWDSDDK